MSSVSSTAAASVSRRSMTRDIHESIRLLLGKNVKILLKAPVKMETKLGGEKTDNRILVFTAYRMFAVTAKVPTRIDHHFHYLDLRHIESTRPNRVVFTFASGQDKTVSFGYRVHNEQSAQTSCKYRPRGPMDKASVS